MMSCYILLVNFFKAETFTIFLVKICMIVIRSYYNQLSLVWYLSSQDIMHSSIRSYGDAHTASKNPALIEA